jgi:hypothetical protein
MTLSRILFTQAYSLSLVIYSLPAIGIRHNIMLLDVKTDNVACKLKESYVKTG